MTEIYHALRTKKEIQANVKEKILLKTSRADTNVIPYQLTNILTSTHIFKHTQYKQTSMRAFCLLEVTVNSVHVWLTGAQSD